MAALARPDLTRALPGLGAILLGGGAAVTIAALPDALLADAVRSTDISALVPFFEPPVGAGARNFLALGTGMVTAALVWAALYLVFGRGRLIGRGPRRGDGVPSVRRADAHPDAPPRRPLSVAELNAATTHPVSDDAEAEDAFAADPFERALPADLETPLSAFDPAAIPPVPRAPVRAVASLAPGERLQTFALSMPPTAHAAAPSSIDALLRRLGQAAQHRAARAQVTG